MASLSSDIKKLLPIDNELKLDALFKLFQERNTSIDINIDARILPLLSSTRLKESYYWRTGRNYSRTGYLSPRLPMPKKEKKKRASGLYSGGLSEDDPLMNSFEKRQLYEQRRQTSNYDKYEYGLSDW